MPLTPFFPRHFKGGGRSQTQGGSTRKIINIKPYADLKELKKEISRQGGSIVKELPLINAYLCEFPEGNHAQVVSVLGAHPSIDSVDEDIIVHITSIPPAYRGPSGPSYSNQPAQEVGWGVKRIGAESFITVDTKSQVKVAVLDTGIFSQHPDLKGNIRGAVSVAGNVNDLSDPNGHGTHVAGIIGALNNSIGIVGVMPKAGLYAVKVFDANGQGSLSDIIHGLQYCIENRIKIVNMSFGSSEDNNSFKQAFINAEKAGIIMVAAAGNDRYQHKMQYPAKYPQTIAVSALSSSGSIASFSSYGPEVDVIAPGENIKSTWKDGMYKQESGTSMATPFVAGAIVQMINKWGDMTPAQAKQHVKSTAQRLAMPGIYQGAGLIDLRAMLNNKPSHLR